MEEQNPGSRVWGVLVICRQVHSYGDWIHWREGENVRKVFCTLWVEYPRERIIFCFWLWGGFFLRAVEDLAKPLYHSASASTLWGQQPAALEQTPASL